MHDLYPAYSPRGTGLQPEGRRWPEEELAPRLQPWADPQATDQVNRRGGRFDRQIEADVLRNFARIGV